MTTDQNSVQRRWVERHARMLEPPLAPETLRQLARLTVDTIAIATYARVHNIGATRDDTAHLGVGDLPVWGDPRGRAILDAAFLNGSAAEALDFQEVLIEGRNNGHAAVVIVPTLLALATAHGVAGERLAHGLRIAFAANISLARTLGRAHRAGEMGFRTTSLTAPIAAALGGALMLENDSDIANHAVGITASSLPAGLLAAMSPLAGDFSVDKDLSVGFSARHATHAVLLARAGATGPGNALSGPRGWVASYGGDSADPIYLENDPLGADLGAYALKLYPANFGCQCAIQLAIDLARNTPPDSVRKLTVRVKSSSAASLSTRDIKTHVAARFSLPYAVASAYVRGRSVLADFEAGALSEPAVSEFMAKIELVADDDLEALHQSKGVFPARLELLRIDGDVQRVALDRPDEGLTNAEADAILIKKIKSLCPPPLSEALCALIKETKDPASFSGFLSLPSR